MSTRKATSCTWVATPVYHRAPTDASGALTAALAVTTAAPHRLHVRLSKRRRRLAMCMESKDVSQGDALNHIIPNLGPPPAVDDADRASMDSITDKGTEEVSDITDELKAGLDDVEAESARLAEELAQKATDELLEQYNEKKEDILKNVDEDRRVIESQIERVKDLAASLEGDDKSDSERRSPAGRVLLATTALFALATVYYAFVGVTTSDGGSLTNAIIDLIFAVASAYFLQQSNKSVDEGDR